MSEAASSTNDNCLLRPGTACVSGRVSCQNILKTCKTQFENMQDTNWMWQTQCHTPIVWELCFTYFHNPCGDGFKSLLQPLAHSLELLGSLLMVSSHKSKKKHHQQGQWWQFTFGFEDNNLQTHINALKTPNLTTYTLNGMTWFTPSPVLQKPGQAQFQPSRPWPSFLWWQAEKPSTHRKTL